jgi:hypothetical protein
MDFSSLDDRSGLAVARSVRIGTEDSIATDARPIKRHPIASTYHAHA